MSKKNKMDGVERIAAERERQIKDHHFDAAHDDEHDRGELAYAAASYAAPRPVFQETRYGYGGDLQIIFGEVWPRDWERVTSARITKASRIRDLERAGALIAAEIDRLLRKEGDEP